VKADYAAMRQDFPRKGGEESKCMAEPRKQPGV